MNREPVDWVNPLIDSANRRYFFFTSASRPFGMVNLSPDTVPRGAWEGGYRYDVPYVCWFGHVHAWQVAGLPVLPTTGPIRGHEGVEVYRSRFSHARETAAPGYHEVFLEDYGVKAELTATVRVAYHRYTFPPSGSAAVLFDLTAEIGPTAISDAMITRVGPDELEGYVENAVTRRRPKPIRIYFVVRFDRAPDELGGWRDGTLLGETGETLRGPGIGAYVRWADGCDRPVIMKVALSYCGIDGARLNMETEAPGWDFDAVRADARDEWNRLLGRIRVEGGREARTVKFYTDLFHALKGRRRACDADGSYCDMTGDAPVVRKPSVPYQHHTTDAFWGSWWTLNVLWSLAYPEKVNDFANTLLSMYRNGGILPRENVGGMYDFVMIGASSTPFMVQASQKRMGGFDPEEAYQGLRRNHFPGGLMGKAGYEYHTAVGGGIEQYIEKGYVPHGIKAEAMHCDGGSMTLEYAFEDWCLARMAKALGKEDDYRLFMARSGNYRNIWDSGTGFFRPRNDDGSFLDPFDPMSPEGWCEANGLHYLWWVPHDVAGLIELMGGRETFVRRLNAQFEESREVCFIAPHGKHHLSPMDYGNQPSTHLAHLFNHAGAPWLAQKWVREVMDRAKSDITPHGGYGGDEDQGQMGALNALMAMGLFQMRGGCEADPVYEITSPVFDRISVRLDPAYYGGTDPVLEIRTTNNAPGAVYIQSVLLNGRPLDRPWFRHSALRGGAILEITLGPEPNEAWGSAPECAPPAGAEE